MNALALRPSAVARRRTCLPRCSSSDMVVLMMLSTIYDHRCIKRESVPVSVVQAKHADITRAHDQYRR